MLFRSRIFLCSVQSKTGTLFIGSAGHLASSSGGSSSGGSSNSASPRVISWYKPNALFDMENVLKLLEDRNIPIEVCFPPLVAHPPAASHPVAASPPCVAPATTDIDHPQPTPSPHPAETPQAGASPAPPARDAPPQRPHVSKNQRSLAKSVEVVGFRVRGSGESSGVMPVLGGSLLHRGEVRPTTTFFVFAEGSLVGWNTTWDELVWMRAILQPTAPTATAATSSLHLSSPAPGQAAVLAADSMRYQLYVTLPMDERPVDLEPDQQSYIDTVSDRIILEDDDVTTKLPFSYALVHSVKLEALHNLLEPIALDVKRWQQHLSIDGTLLCNLKTLRKSKTKLLSIVDALNFKHQAQTTPRIFWSGEYQTLRSLYHDACEHLEVEDRSQSLKAQLETMDESLTYLHDEVHANMNEWLTWVIIVLIACELFVAAGGLQRLVGLIRSWRRNAPQLGQKDA